MNISMDRITPDPDQPRKTFDDDALHELAASIQANGLIQAITVRPAARKGYFIIVAGERRWRAHKLLGVAKIPASVITGRDAADILAAQIVENLQRSEVAPLEEAEAFAVLCRYGWSEAQIAAKLGLAPFRVVWRLRLLNLEPGVRLLVEHEQVDRQTAMEVARLDDHADQRRVVQMVNRRELVGWKAVRNAVDAIMGVASAPDMFGDAAALPRREQIETVRGMERRIDSVIDAVAAGWRDGECVIAHLVDPNRARVMAEKLALLRKTISTMERELQNTAGQAVLTFEGTLI